VACALLDQTAADVRGHGLPDLSALSRIPRTRLRALPNLVDELARLTADENPADYQALLNFSQSARTIAFPNRVVSGSTAPPNPSTPPKSTSASHGFSSSSPAAESEHTTPQQMVVSVASVSRPASPPNTARLRPPSASSLPPTEEHADPEDDDYNARITSDSMPPPAAAASSPSGHRRSSLTSSFSSLDLSTLGEDTQGASVEVFRRIAAFEALLNNEASIDARYGLRARASCVIVPLTWYCRFKDRMSRRIRVISLAFEAVLKRLREENTSLRAELQTLELRLQDVCARVGASVACDSLTLHRSVGSICSRLVRTQTDGRQRRCGRVYRSPASSFGLLSLQEC
jgi:hypothetical protein